ncbi:MAG: hypothetical protein Kow00109_06430 [Acidobacteriota bacterium]
MAEEKALSGTQARLEDLEAVCRQLKRETEDGFRQFLAALTELRERSKTLRETRRRLEDALAEVLYLRLTHHLPEDGLARPEIPWSEAEALWMEIKAQWQAVGPSRTWLERIREAEERRAQAPILSDEDRQELRRLLEEVVCPICVSYSLDGTCHQEAFEDCPIEMFLDRLVRMVAEMGHRPWMEEYFEGMYREVCPHCSGRDASGACPPREEGDCSLYTYLPTVVRTIEDFLKQKGVL